MNKRTGSHRFFFPMLALILTGGLVGAADSDLDIDEDAGDGWAQTRYYASSAELLEVHYEDSSECHVWGHGVVTTGNAQNWARIAGDQEVYDGLIWDTEVPQWRVNVRFEYDVDATYPNSGDGFMIMNYTKLTGDVVQLDGIRFAGGDRIELDENEDPLDQYTVFSHNGTPFKIDQETLDEGQTNGYYNILVGYNLIGVVNTASLDVTMLQLVDMQLHTVSSGGDLDIKCQNNDESKDSINGVIESWDMDAGVLLHSYPVE